MRIVALCGLLALVGIVRAVEPTGWIEPGQAGVLPAMVEYDNEFGKLGIYNAKGPQDLRRNAFFAPIGSNGRACVTCHQPRDAMSLSAASAQARWKATQGMDPLFAAIDGSNCPSLPQGIASSHSLLLERALFRVNLPWPPKNADGSRMQPEFTLEVVSDPSTCNLDPVYGIQGKAREVSVFRHSRVAANLKHIVFRGLTFEVKRGEPTDVDPETGAALNQNIMADAREPTLSTQMSNATLGHAAAKQVSKAAIRQAVEYESQVYTAQVSHTQAGPLVEPGGPENLGPKAIADGPLGLGDSYATPAFGYFDSWKAATGTDARTAYRQSVARGMEIFLVRPFWIRDVNRFNTIGLGNPIKRTCATCHNTRFTGSDQAPGTLDVGTSNIPWARQLPSQPKGLPMFKATCDKSAHPHPYLGRVIYTTDPGRALISGLCRDIGGITMQQLRGLTARAPYFSNGGALTLAEVVEFYERRFEIGLSAQDKTDLVNFLSVL